MRLHNFILKNLEQILVEWERFARTCAPASANMDVAALRDHAGEMLIVIAADLETFQGDFEQAEKSKGHAPDTGGSRFTAAEAHGAERAMNGFDVRALVAEFRALRASVLRLWEREVGEFTPAEIDDMTRFNEAIDQALAESISQFTESVENAKDIFLAVLGHDLRNPLGAIYTSALTISETDEMNESDRVLALRISERAMQATRMVGDLLDFTRSRLGSGIPIDRAEVDLKKIVDDVADELMAAHPGSNVQVETGEGFVGQWDEARIRQALGNLVGNAVEHSDSGGAVTVALENGEEGVAIRIHNRGTAISADRLDGIFNSMKPGVSIENRSTHGPSGHLGLGLYIAERIVNAHDGRIEVESSEAQGTTFTVHLPWSD